ncbi:E3 ubiquitin-protein ligase MSL2b isoform X3 [Gymnodraco acuticeps]|uniref:E3 ubiquitin-protein ligase MSL2 n=1 Tax=Gymnodraco acuticeps TaxID=8218 RepID=A0A6P8TS17_GYMAC|nr:E3 ubiquitin-protein ligase MSL2b isoform X3 [Gymnodraco acuticeps]
MNPVNATSLYVSASRSVLQCDPRDPRALAELCKLLPFFRQSLSCLVCGNLLQDPIAPTNSSCQHYVCRGCKGQRMQLKPSCSWCKDYSRFEENRQLSLLVHCYQKLCLYITQSPLAPHIASAASDSPDLQAILNEGLTLAERAGLCEISTFGDDLKHSGGPLLLSVEEVLRTLDTDPDPLPHLDCPPSVPQSSLNGPHSPPDSSRLITCLPQGNSPRPLQPHPQPSLQPPPQPSTVTPHVPPRYHRKRSRSESDSEKVQPLPISSLLRGPPLGANSSPHHPHPGATTKQEPEYPAVTPHPHLAPVPNGGPPKVGKTVLVSNKALKKTVEHHGGPKKAYTKARQGTPKPRTQTRDRIPQHPHAHPLTHPPSPSKPLYKKPVEKKGCKCGRATQNPSVLTCRGQRCPCYSNRKACLDCICRGCQNSYMANGEKKLEAFAVPEKALEQTRLTLGINLTSITAAALRPATSSPGNTLLNVTTATGTPVTASFLSGAGHDNRAFEDSLEMRFDC